jgi:hypothetical protein
LLPLHAATSSGKNQGSCADYFVPSYTPTLKALLNPQHAFRSVYREDAKALLVAVPEPFQGQLLPAVVDEIEAARVTIPPSSIIHLASDPGCLFKDAAGPTASMILDALPEATVFHLASHGIQVSTIVLRASN